MSSNPYSHYYRNAFHFDQEHRTAGSVSLFKTHQSEPGHFLIPSVAGPSIQVNLAPRKGQGELDFGARRFVAKIAKNLFVVSPGDRTCEYRIPTDLHLLIVSFVGDPFLEVLGPGQDLGFMHSVAMYDPVVVRLVQYLWDRSGEGAPLLELNSLEMALVSYVAATSRQAKPVERQAYGGLAPWQKRLVCERMADHAQDASLKELAAIANLSPEHFCRAFKQSTGVSPHQWLIRHRIEKACGLLVDTKLPISDLAAAVGYDDPSYFARLFRRTIGVSPSVWRRTNQ